MEEILLTKEEFIQLIKENNVGVTIIDFEGVSIDDFILYYRITKEVSEQFVSGEFTLSQIVQSFKKNAPRIKQEMQRAPYLVRELVYVESTDEEYLAFIDRYFDALQLEAEFIQKHENGVLMYRVYEDRGFTNFEFCQTAKSRDLPLSKGVNDREENYKIELQAGDMSHYLNIYYSKSGKYLMYADGRSDYSYEEWLNLYKTFCELDD